MKEINSEIAVPILMDVLKISIPSFNVDELEKILAVQAGD